jgi:hypothetical protein
MTKSRKRKLGQRVTKDIQSSSVNLNHVSIRKENIKIRFWLMIDYVTIPIFTAIVYAVFLTCTHIILSLGWYLLSDDIQNSETIANLAEWARIGITSTTLVGMLVHTGYSLLGQIMVEQQLKVSDEERK